MDESLTEEHDPMALWELVTDGVSTRARNASSELWVSSLIELIDEFIPDDFERLTSFKVLNYRNMGIKSYAELVRRIDTLAPVFGEAFQQEWSRRKARAREFCRNGVTFRLRDLFSTGVFD